MQTRRRERKTVMQIPHVLDDAGPCWKMGRRECVSGRLSGLGTFRTFCTTSSKLSRRTLKTRSDAVILKHRTAANDVKTNRKCLMHEIVMSLKAIMEGDGYYAEAPPPVRVSLHLLLLRCVNYF